MFFNGDSNRNSIFMAAELSLGFWKQEFRTPIWQKVGVPLEKVGVPLKKKLESHQSVHTVYLFHFSRKWYIWIIFRLTDLNPLSINGLFLLNKTNYFAIFFHNLNTHFFVWPYQTKRLNCWYLFYSLTRQTDRQTDRQADRQDRQQSSVLYNLMQMEVFFSYKNASR